MPKKDKSTHNALKIDHIPRNFFIILPSENFPCFYFVITLSTPKGCFKIFQIFQKMISSSTPPFKFQKTREKFCRHGYAFDWEAVKVHPKLNMASCLFELKMRAILFIPRIFSCDTNNTLLMNFSSIPKIYHSFTIST